MPIIQVTMGKLERKKKRELITKLTETAMEVTGIPEHAFSCAIHELESDAFRLGKKTVYDIQEEMKNK